ncbi:CLI_3235 family bacteriocin precursor [Paenibacillus kribbensis]|uniref:CLI_3235 family bacteriocin precursor n=1 Tax=Paenibacillus kribbensis TaxID=172713 RepID=UPI0015C0B203
MRKLVKRNMSMSDTIEAFGCTCSCYCPCSCYCQGTLRNSTNLRENTVSYSREFLSRSLVSA